MKIQHVSVFVFFAFFLRYLPFVLKQCVETNNVYVLKEEVIPLDGEIILKNSLLLF